jgi:hypothetical protein
MRTGWRCVVKLTVRLFELPKRKSNIHWAVSILLDPKRVETFGEEKNVCPCRNWESTVPHCTLCVAGFIFDIIAPPPPPAWSFVLVLFSCSGVGASSALFHSGFPTLISYQFLFSPVHSTCFAHLTLLHMTQYLAKNNANYKALPHVIFCHFIILSVLDSCIIIIICYQAAAVYVDIVF